MKDKINKLYELIKDSNNIVFYGGAGVSTESGIPDFRSKDGLYNTSDVRFNSYSPEFLLSREALHHAPKVFYEFYRQKMDTRHVSPNITHKFLVKLEEMGKLKGIVTQNIDGLHHMAGSEIVYEIHGTSKRCKCDKCEKEYDGDYIFNSKEAIPSCDCKGRIRPDITLYGEKLPKAAYDGASRLIREADLLIIAGTSLTVYPAADLINEFEGRNIVIINREEICHPMARGTGLFIKGSLGNVFTEVSILLNCNDADNGWISVYDRKPPYNKDLLIVYESNICGDYDCYIAEGKYVASLHGDYFSGDSACSKGTYWRVKDLIPYPDRVVRKKMECCLRNKINPQAILEYQRECGILKDYYKPINKEIKN